MHAHTTVALFVLSKTRVVGIRVTRKALELSRSIHHFKCSCINTNNNYNVLLSRQYVTALTL